MTQEEFDTRVAVFVNKHLCRTDRIASFDISKDPYTSDLKTREIFFENIISSLNGYDLSLALFTEKELSYLFELGMLAGRSCGKCTDWFPRIRYTPAEPIFTPVSYGLLYNWYAATDPRNIASAGWHVPTRTEFQTLSTYLGGDAIVGGKLKEIGYTYWNSPNTDATNEIGFNGRGAGYLFEGIFYSILEQETFWTQSETFIDAAWIFSLFYDYEGIFFNSTIKAEGYSVRLLKDTTILAHGQTGTYAGNDGKVYRTICIGTQEWLADNLCETLYRNGDPIPEVTDNATWAALTTGAMCAYNNDWNNV